MTVIPQLDTFTSSGKEHPSAAKIWERLSSINVNEHVKEKNGMSYLSWAYAWGIMMENYPGLEYKFTIFGLPDKDAISSANYQLDGSASVECTVTIGIISRTMWLPCMTGYKNSAVNNPSSRDVGDAKMRCLVKCFAMFGLGHYLYAGEDLPEENPTHAEEQPMSSGPVALDGPEEKKEKLGDEDPKAAVIVLEFSLENIHSVEEVDEYWKKNMDQLKRWHNTDTEFYNKVRQMFADRKQQIRSQDNG